MTKAPAEWRHGDIVEDAYGNPAFVTRAEPYNGDLRVTMLAGSDWGRRASVRMNTAVEVTDDARVAWAKERFAALGAR